jgi:hypothetical protein
MTSTRNAQQLRFFTRDFCNRKQVRKLRRLLTTYSVDDAKGLEVHLLAWPYVSFAIHNTHDAFLDALVDLLAATGSLRINSVYRFDVAQVRSATQFIAEQTANPSQALMRLYPAAMCRKKCYCTKRMASDAAASETALQLAKELGGALVTSFDFKCSKYTPFSENDWRPRGFAGHIHACSTLKEMIAAKDTRVVDLVRVLKTVSAGAVRVLNPFIREWIVTEI